MNHHNLPIPSSGNGAALAMYDYSNSVTAIPPVVTDKHAGFGSPVVPRASRVGSRGNLAKKFTPGYLRPFLDARKSDVRWQAESMLSSEAAATHSWEETQASPRVHQIQVGAV